MTREAVLSFTKVDCISRRRASEMLDMCSTIMARHAISTLDLTAGTTFAWWRWLANLEVQALDMLFADHGVHSLWARRVDQHMLCGPAGGRSGFLLGHIQGGRRHQRAACA